MSRILLVMLVLLATAGAVVAYGDPDQIARWHRMESEERQTVMAQLPARMAEAGLPQLAPAVSPKSG